MMRRNSPYASEKGPLIALVTTPIGNLQDITYRAVEYLRDADIIACEDTRNTGLLLSQVGIKPKKLVALYAQTELKNAKSLVREVKENGYHLAYCSDAGMPGISDPGALLVQAAREEDVPVTVLPGPTASLSALVISGIDSADFSFYGFLPTKKGAIKALLEPLKERTETLIFYESPKRVLATLALMKDVFGEERQATLVRELTKIHEETIQGTLGELASLTEEIRGECVIVIAGDKEKKEADPEDLKKQIREGLREGKSLSSLAKEIAEKNHVGKNLVYKLGLEISK
jgi:16S rRNA (cytidine1402-2'-O)-methyltransferase